MKITIILLLTLTASCCICTTNGIRRKTEIQRQILDGLVRLITKRSFPDLLREMRKYFKSRDAIRKFITDAVIWKSDQLKRVYRMVQDKVDAVESILWLLFKTRSKPKGRPTWEWLDSNYEWTRKGQKVTRYIDDAGNQDYNNNNNNRDYNDGGGEEGDNGDDGDDGNDQ